MVNFIIQFALTDKFKKVCYIFNIVIQLSSSIIKTTNAYLAGLIDADGSILISIYPV